MSTIRADNIVSSGGANTATINGVTPALSSQAQAEAGTDNTTQLTPLRLRNALNATGSAPVYACRAWVNFNGTGTVAIRASGNVSSITDIGIGTYTVNFATAMPDANYAIAGFCNFGPSTAAAGVVTFGNAFAPAAGSCQIISANSTSAATQDAQHVHVSIFR